METMFDFIHDMLSDRGWNDKVSGTDWIRYSYQGLAQDKPDYTLELIETPNGCKVRKIKDGKTIKETNFPSVFDKLDKIAPYHS